MYESSEANELLDMAVEYNVLPPKKEKKFRRDMQTGDMKTADLVQNLQVRLAGLPIPMPTPCSLPPQGAGCPTPCKGDSM